MARFRFFQGRDPSVDFRRSLLGIQNNADQISVWGSQKVCQECASFKRLSLSQRLTARGRASAACKSKPNVPRVTNRKHLSARGKLPRSHGNAANAGYPRLPLTAKHPPRGADRDGLTQGCNCLPLSAPLLLRPTLLWDASPLFQEARCCSSTASET